MARRNQKQPEPVELTQEQMIEAKESLRALFDERDLLPSNASLAEVQAADRRLEQQILKMDWPERPAPEQEPVLFELVELADRRHQFAYRLLLQQRIEVRLPQDRAPQAKQPSETVVISGVILRIPRGIRFQVPQTVAELLENAGLI